MRKKKYKIYIASPYSLGDAAKNVRRQMEAFNILMDNGFIPFAPLLSHFQEIFFHRDWDDWLELDLEWLGVCHGLWRLSGESKGADIEVSEAVKNNIPVFYSIKAIREYFNISWFPEYK